MPIKIYNENRLTRQPVFKLLIEYLATHAENEVTLRDLHKIFADQPNFDRHLENFIKAGYIQRQNKRYTNQFHLFDDSDFSTEQIQAAVANTETPSDNRYDQPIFVKSGSQIDQLLSASKCYQSLTNNVNAIELHFTTNFDFKERLDIQTYPASLANYFIKVAQDLPLTDFEQEIYALLGDVDPNYALKYMTSFLLRFKRKDVIKRKADIFITALVKCNIIEDLGEQNYRLQIDFESPEKVPPTRTFTDPKDFILAQIGQTMALKNFIIVGE